ncbi:hypothetical protein [Streptomyces iconiensis]|uniref:Secreted protein n=1 Tax=Streptomyces iconiensis TaxID=1384038 RepID=A0ABT6ZR82_9ACTN|nr:hypothetical protein [Streptomyces iconiensis]MDJ1131571.1 hypothetical protein [Streptomyces iconiensis]
MPRSLRAPGSFRAPRRATVALLGALGLAMAATAATAGPAAAAATSPAISQPTSQPTSQLTSLAASRSAPASGGGTFASCPTRAQLPEGADPSAWRCEVMTATGRLTVGALSVPLEKPITVTHAEGRIDGVFHQVFGGLKSEPVRIPGSPLRLTMRYGGSFDFHSNDERLGELSVRFLLADRGGLLPRNCAIGSTAKPVQLTLKVVGEPQPGQMPDAQDKTFTAPRTSGCGPLGRLLDRGLDLPAPAGQNEIFLDGDRAIRAYTDLP